jgi:hypothetical protein
MLLHTTVASSGDARKLQDIRSPCGIDRADSVHVLSCPSLQTVRMAMEIVRNDDYILSSLLSVAVSIRATNLTFYRKYVQYLYLQINLLKN